MAPDLAPSRDRQAPPSLTQTIVGISCMPKAPECVVNMRVGVCRTGQREAEGGDRRRALSGDEARLLILVAPFPRASRPTSPSRS